MNLAGLIATYGYLAVAIGTFLEGETMLLMAGFAAHRGYLDLWNVILVAFVASFLGDQCAGGRPWITLRLRFTTYQTEIAVQRTGATSVELFLNNA